MADVHGIKTRDIKSTDRHGTQGYVQASDGTGTSGNVPKFNADGSLTDGGVVAANIITATMLDGTTITVSGGVVSATGGGGAGTWAQEVPSGTKDGSNVTFTLAYTPVANSLSVYRNGDLQDPNWISVSGSTITFVAAPNSYDQIYARYQH